MMYDNICLYIYLAKVWIIVLIYQRLMSVLVDFSYWLTIWREEPNSSGLLCVILGMILRYIMCHFLLEEHHTVICSQGGIQSIHICSKRNKKQSNAFNHWLHLICMVQIYRRLKSNCSKLAWLHTISSVIDTKNSLYLPMYLFYHSKFHKYSFIIG